MSAVLVRILLRWLAGALVTYGVITADMSAIITGDPDLANWLTQAVTILAGVASGVIAEAWYWLAKRFGWST